MSEKTYNTEDAAKRAGVHYVTLRRWLARGKFTPSVGIEMADGRKLWRFTEADVRDLAKLAGKYAEQQRVAVRNVRRDAIDELKKAEKDGALTQDELKRMSDEIQSFTDQAIKRVDELLKTKEQEIMQV